MIDKVVKRDLINKETASFLYDFDSGYIYVSNDAASLLKINGEDLLTSEGCKYMTHDVMCNKYVESSSRELFESMLQQVEEDSKKYSINFVNSGTCIVLNGIYIKARAIYDQNKRFVFASLEINENWYASCPSLMSKFTISPFSGLKNKYALYNAPPGAFKEGKIYMILIGNYKLIEREHGAESSEKIRSIVDEIIRYTIWDQVYHFEKDKIVIIDNKGLNANELYVDLCSFVHAISRGLGVFVSMCSISHDAFTYDSIAKFFYVADIFVSNTSLNHRGEFLHVDKKIYDKYKKRDSINNIIINAVRNNDIGVAYQPQVCLKTGRVVGFEALLRPDIYEMPISTDRFINVCNTNGIITKLDESVLSKALQMYNKVRESGYDMEGFTLSVNITPESLPVINVELLKEIVKNANVPIESVKFELIEEILIGENEVKVLKELSNAGFKIALDDFSAGHSSLKYLYKINPDAVKLDKTLIPDITNNKEKIVYKYITNLCKELDLSIIAEGVESEEELEFVKEVGVDIVQGYYYSKALKEEEFINYIINNKK